MSEIDAIINKYPPPEWATHYCTSGTGFYFNREYYCLLNKLDRKEKWTSDHYNFWSTHEYSTELHINLENE